MVYLITYDLNKAGKNYDGLYKAIRAFGNPWHYLDSTWLIETKYSATQVYNQLAKEVDKDDYLFVVKVSQDYQGWLVQAAWDWLNKANFN